MSDYVFNIIKDIYNFLLFSYSLDTILTNCPLINVLLWINLVIIPTDDTKLKFPMSNVKLFSRRCLILI